MPNPLNQENTNDADELINNIRKGFALSDARGRKLVVPEIKPQPTWSKSPFYHPREFKKGGLIRTGLVKVHKGEFIFTKISRRFENCDKILRANQNSTKRSQRKSRPRRLQSADSRSR